jgi:hypothetical protein
VRAYKIRRPNDTWGPPIFDEEFYDQSVHKRMSKIDGPVHLSIDGDPFGPYVSRGTGTTRLLNKSHDGKAGDWYRLWNKDKKGVTTRIVDAKRNYGNIFPTTGPCKDDYPNIKVAHNMAGQLVKLQEPALLSYLDAERINGHAIQLTGYPFGGWRSCEIQSQLYRSDPGRFADPDGSRHCRGLAIDVYYSSSNLTAKARAALVSLGWNFAVSGEPWHCSYIESG